MNQKKQKFFLVTYKKEYLCCKENKLIKYTDIGNLICRDEKETIYEFYNILTKSTIILFRSHLVYFSN